MQKPAQPQPQGQGRPGMMQQLTPEQVQNQRVEQKANELQAKETIRQDPGNAPQTLTDKLKARLLPPRPKLKPDPTMKVMSNNGELLGASK